MKISPQFRNTLTDWVVYALVGIGLVLAGILMAIAWVVYLAFAIAVVSVTLLWTNWKGTLAFSASFALIIVAGHYVGWW